MGSAALCVFTCVHNVIGIAIVTEELLDLFSDAFLRVIVDEVRCLDD